MTHCLNAIIGKNKVIVDFSNTWIEAQSIELTQEFSLIKITNVLLDDINELVDNKSQDPYKDYFHYLSSSLDEILICQSKNTQLAYIETDYFGGIGSQAALLYENNIIKIKPLKTKDE